MNKLIVSLDVDNLSQAIELIDILSPKVEIFKVGIAPFTNFGEQLLAKLHSEQKEVFLDLKFHDIPNTVKNAAKVCAQKNIFMMNFHCLGGLKMLQAAVAGVKETATKKTLLIGVTILTSMEEADMQDVGLQTTVQDRVIALAKLAKSAGLDGVVASAKEAKLIKENVGQDFIVVTPGIRPAWSISGKEDQKRVLTPSQAIAQGADYLVVGRPIIKAQDPLEAASKIIDEIKGYSKN
jgi:orotidine-5'-phosphate decarboxylase